MKDYPKPNIEALKLDKDVKKQIERLGKDPHYRVEKHLYNLQKQILDMAGPLTCLWADLLNQLIPRMSSYSCTVHWPS